MALRATGSQLWQQCLSCFPVAGQGNGRKVAGGLVAIKRQRPHFFRQVLFRLCHFVQFTVISPKRHAQLQSRHLAGVVDLAGSQETHHLIQRRHAAAHLLAHRQTCWRRHTHELTRVIRSDRGSDRPSARDCRLGGNSAPLWRRPCRGLCFGRRLDCWEVFSRHGQGRLHPQAAGHQDQTDGCFHRVRYE